MANKPLTNKEMLESADNFEEAYKSHAGSIHKFLFWRTNDVQLSEDLTSSTFVKAWVSRRSFRGGSVRAWLQRIACNVLIDHWRKNREYAVEDIEALAQETRPGEAEILDKKLQIQDLRKALGKLPDNMRVVVSMRFIDGLSCKQVANKLGLGESNVRVMQYRALKKLREHLK